MSAAERLLAFRSVLRPGLEGWIARNKSFRSRQAFFGAKSGLVSTVIRSDMALFLVSSRAFDRQGRSDFSRAVAPDVFYDGLCCRMRLRHGGDMRRYDHLRMGPERVAFRQRLGIGNVEHGCRKAAAVERLDESALVELRAAANMQQPCSCRQKREHPAFRMPRVCSVRGRRQTRIPFPSGNCQADRRHESR